MFQSNNTKAEMELEIAALHKRIENLMALLKEGRIPVPHQLSDAWSDERGATGKTGPETPLPQETGACAAVPVWPDRPNDLYRSVIDAFTLCAFVVDRDQRIVLANKPFKEWLALRDISAQVIGRRVSDVLPFPPATVEQAYGHVFQTKEVFVFEASSFALGNAVISFSRNIPLFEDEGVPLVLTFINDITARRQAERRLFQRLALEEALSRASRLLISPGNVDLSDVLGILGETLEAHRAVLFRFDEDGVKAAITHEWVSPEIESAAGPVRNVDMRDFSWGMEQFRSGRNIAVPDVGQLPLVASAERERSRLRGIRAFLAAPVFNMDGLLEGFLTFEDTEKARQWSEEDARALRVAAEMIAAYQERRRIVGNLRIRRHLALALSASADLNEAMNLCLDAAIKVANMDCGGVYLLSEESGSLTLACHKGLSPEFAQEAASYSLDTPQGRLVMAGKPAYSALLDETRELSLREGLRAVAVIPLLHEGKVIGCLNVGSHKRASVPAAAQGNLEAIGDMSAGALARIKAEAALRRAHDTLEARVKERTAQLEESNQKLRESEEKFRSTVDGMDDGVHVIDADFRIRLFNEGFRKICANLNVTVGNVIGKDLFDVFPFHSGAVRDEYLRVFQSGELLVTTERNEFAGREVITETRKIPMTEEGRVSRIITVLRDVTEQKRAEENLKKLEERYRLVVENASDVIHIAQDGRIKYSNPRAQEVTGYSPEEFASRPFVEFVHPEDREMVINYNRQRESGIQNPPDYAFRHLCKDGSIRWIEVHATPIVWEGKAGTLAFGADITERKRAEDALRRSEALYRSTVDAMDDGVNVISPDYRITLVNQGYRKLCRDAGFNVDDSIGKGLFEALPFLSDGVKEEYRRVFSSGQMLVTAESNVLDNREIATETRKIPVFEGGHVNRVVTVIRDITRRKQAEDALRESEARFRSVVEAASPNYVVYRLAYPDPPSVEQMECHVISPTVESMLGLTPDQVVADPRVFLNLMAEEDRRRFFQEKARQREAGDVLSVRTRMTHQRTGRQVWVDCHARFVRSKEDGTIQEIGILIDVTQEIRAFEEVRARDRQLEHADRLAALGHLAAGVAHEINQPLSAILTYAGNCEMMLKRGGGVGEALGNVDLIKQQVRQAKGIIRQVGRLSDKRPGQRGALDLVALVRDVVGFFRNRLELESIAIEESLPESPLTIYGERIAIEQVLTNLVSNAEKAMKTGAERRLSIRAGRSPDGALARIAVSDTGKGLTDEEVERIFEPFYTTSEIGEGIGLGLSISRRIIADLGGTILASGEPGKGATFTITLPLADVSEPLAK